MAFRKLVGSYKDYNLSTHIIEKGYLAVDVDTGSLRIGDGETAGGLQSDEEDQSPLHQGTPGGLREREEGGLQQQDQGHRQVTGGGGLGQF